MKAGIVKIRDLLEKYVYLDRDLVYEMLGEIQKFITLKKFSNLIEIPYKKLMKFRSKKNSQKCILVKELRMISEFLVNKGLKNYSFDNLKITGIGKYNGILDPKFPIQFTNEEGVSIIADTLTDGSIDLRSRLNYTNSDPLQIVNNLKQINLLFGGYEIKVTNEEFPVSSDKINCLKVLEGIAKRSKIRARIYVKGNSLVYFIVYTEVAGRILESLDIPKSRRVYSNPELPKFLFLLPKKLIFKFFERIVVNEGNVSKRKIEIFHSIDVTNFLSGSKSVKKLKKTLSKKKLIPQLLLDYIKLLKSVGCKPSKPRIKKIYFTKENETRVSWKIMLTGQSLEILRKNFDLEATINKKLFPLLERESMELHLPQEERLEQITNVFKTNKKIKSYKIASKIGLSQSSTVDYLKMLREKGKINIIRNKCGTTYELTN